MYFGVPGSVEMSDSKGIRLTNNVALRNGSGAPGVYGYIMDVTENGGAGALLPVDMFPPVGIVNTTKGIVNHPLFPMPNLPGVVPVESHPAAVIKDGILGGNSSLFFANGVHGNYSDAQQAFGIAK